jgi:hypothetical protein
MRAIEQLHLPFDHRHGRELGYSCYGNHLALNAVPYRVWPGELLWLLDMCFKSIAHHSRPIKGAAMDPLIIINTPQFRGPPFIFLPDVRLRPSRCISRPDPGGTTPPSLLDNELRPGVARPHRLVLVCGP